MKKTIVTIGMFDGVHRGHRHILEQLRSEADTRGLEAIVYTFDRHPQQVLRGTDVVSLLTSHEERIQRIRQAGNFTIVELPFNQTMAALSACEFYDRVLAADDAPAALLMGYDNVFGNRERDDFALLRQRLSADGVTLIDVQPLMVDGIAVSSTRIRKALAAGRVDEAARLLGYPYALTGTVVRGRQLGRTIGVPTANVDIVGGCKQIPAEGVYAVDAEYQGQRYRAVANLGPQPTVDGKECWLEVHLLHHHGDLYGSQLTISFIHRLRDIRLFESVNSLRQQIMTDIQQCEAI